MMLSNPGRPLFIVNKVIILLKLADEIGFPNFPLSITKDKAAEVAEKTADPWRNTEKEDMFGALTSMYSGTLSVIAWLFI